jgi:hypothetical protein
MEGEKKDETGRVLKQKKKKEARKEICSRITKTTNGRS